MLTRTPRKAPGVPTVLIDAENVRRSRWPNLSKAELVSESRAWATQEGMALIVVFEGSAPEEAADLVAGRPTADDWLAAHAAAFEPYWLVTSDRELRRRAARVVGGGTFLGLIREAG
jgi:hypothetical protein